MDDLYAVDINYDGEVLSFDTKLAAVGYTHRFYVKVGSAEVVYEPDEERNYRAIVSGDALHDLSDRDKEMIRLIGERLGEIEG